MGFLVLVRREGGRWRADVYSRLGGGRARRVAEVVGSLACVRLVVVAGAPLLGKPEGLRLFLDFLSANRCRIVEPASVAHRLLAADQPADANP